MRTIKVTYEEASTVQQFFTKGMNGTIPKETTRLALKSLFKFEPEIKSFQGTCIEIRNEMTKKISESQNPVEISLFQQESTEKINELSAQEFEIDLAEDEIGAILKVTNNLIDELCSKEEARKVNMGNGNFAFISASQIMVMESFVNKLSNV